MPRIFVSVLSLGMFAVAVAGCARVSAGARPSGDGGEQDAPSTDSPFDGQGTGGGTGGGSQGGGKDLPVCTACTADLHGITDCDGNLITSCPSDKGCRAGACVDPCEAAQANGSAQGCDFYSVVPAPHGGDGESCFAAMLANTWNAPITIKVEYAGMSLDVAAIARSPSGSGTTLSYVPLPGGTLAPGQMAILFLSHGSHGLPCPIEAGVATDPSVNGTGLARAFHISSSAPVVAYDIYPYGGASSLISSATLLIPTSAWGINYIAADGYQQAPSLAQFAPGNGPAVQIVAAQDETVVTINPTVPIVGGGGVAATAAGQARTYSLAKGQVLQFQQPTELAGSTISADKAVGVWGGSSCMEIPVDRPGCDGAHQQLVPVNLLGFEYAGVSYRDRLPQLHETVPWTLIGAVDGTMLTYDPAPPAGAPASINRGQSVRFSSASPFIVRSTDQQHPFYLAGHMTSCETLNEKVNCRGDPEFVNTVPPRQWLNSYVFLSDPTYKTTNLVFVRQKVGQSFRDVTLDCIGTLTGWTPIGTDGVYEFTRVDLVADGVLNGACNNGAHTASSDAAFGLTVWGWDYAVSYAYPAGMSVRKINTVIVVP